MPWPKEHKQATRERILEAAAAAYRELGTDAGVSDVMQRAGLTHGAFYAHFDSKDDLLAEAIGCAAEQSNAMLAGGEDRHGRDAVLAQAERYLSRLHLEHPERGCPIAAIGPELARGSKPVRKSFDTAINKRLDRLRDELARDEPDGAARIHASGALACMVGAMVVARGLNPKDGAAFLDDALKFLRESLS